MNKPTPTWVRLEMDAYKHNFRSPDEFRRFTSKILDGPDYGFIYNRDEACNIKQDRPSIFFGIKGDTLSLTAINVRDGLGQDFLAILGAAITRVANKLNCSVRFSSGVHNIRSGVMSYVAHNIAFTSRSMRKVLQGGECISSMVERMIRSSIESRFVIPAISVRVTEQNVSAMQIMDRRIMIPRAVFELPIQILGPWFVGGYTNKGCGCVEIYEVTP